MRGEVSIKIAALLMLLQIVEESQGYTRIFHGKLSSALPIQSRGSPSEEGNRMQRVLLSSSSSLSTSDHSPISFDSSDENSIESVNHGMTTSTSSLRDSSPMARAAQEDYAKITREPEKAAIRKREAATTTEAAQSTTTLSSLDGGEDIVNNELNGSLSTTTTDAPATPPSLEKYPYAESNYPQAHLVSITTNRPEAAQFSPSQIDYFLHHQRRQSSESSFVPFCYELSGNLRYVSNKFQPQGVWSSVHYYYNDPYYSSLVGQHR